MSSKDRRSWRPCAGGAHEEHRPPSSAMKRPSCCSPSRRSGDDEWCMSLTRALPVASGYVRRWQIEQTWRYDKSELAFQSPRLWHWQEREKLLLMATLAYAFLLTLLEPCYDPLRLWLLRHYCYRTGWHCRNAKAPLYRLRSALSRLWHKYPPNFALLGQRPLPSVRLLAA